MILFRTNINRFILVVFTNFAAKYVYDFKKILFMHSIYVFKHWIYKLKENNLRYWRIIKGVKRKKMNIILNNRKEEIPGKTELSVQELILYKNFTFHMLVTKVNEKLVKKEVRTEVTIQEGDNVVVMHLISGG